MFILYLRQGFSHSTNFVDISNAICIYGTLHKYFYWFRCLIAYQFSWGILDRSHLFRKTVVELFNSWVFREFMPLPVSISPRVKSWLNSNSLTMILQSSTLITTSPRLLPCISIYQIKLRLIYLFHGLCYCPVVGSENLLTVSFADG